ncbi:hypothetical protein [Cupriavidus basilensis]|nr:hypothetical protein [Cupriavidus basilensis]
MEDAKIRLAAQWIRDAGALIITAGAGIGVDPGCRIFAVRMASGGYIQR